MKIMLTQLSYKMLCNNLTQAVARPVDKGLAKDIVSFSSSSVDKDDAYNLKNIPGLPCACCGKQMINESVARSYTAKFFQGPATNVLVKMKGLSKDFRTTEKTVYNLLKRSAQKNPNDDLNGLLNKRYHYHLSRLEQKQLSVINKAVRAGDKLSEKSRKELDKTLVKVREIMFIESKNEPQKRGRIIEEFQKLSKKIPEKDISKKILEILQNLPNSYNDVDSFVTKYSLRENREIGQRLIKPAEPSLDHVKALTQNGDDDFSNIVVLCHKCNFEKGDMSLKKWLLLHPEMYKHSQRNIDCIIKEINSGRLKNFDTYPKDIAKTLYQESGRKLKIDTKALKTKH